MQRAQLLSRQLTRSISTTKMAEYRLNHTMFRIKDPNVSLKFYEQHFNMTLLSKMEIAPLGFTNYFLGFKGDKSLHKNAPWYEREGVLELCHNHGVEKDPNYTLNNGNVEPHRGFGHICFSVNNLEDACNTLEKNGVSFKKRLSEGRQKNIAFALDPDGYWIELIENSEIPTGDAYVPADNRFNHTMVRIKDPKKALKFYQEDLGMTLLRTAEFEAAKFTLYFLAFNKDPNFVPNSGAGVSNREGILELTWNWGTENDADFAYHNGNAEPQGYGHIGITVPDVDAAVAHLESRGVTIKKRKTDGKMKFIAFVADPDGYMIELLPPADMPENPLSD